MTQPTKNPPKRRDTAVNPDACNYEDFRENFRRISKMSDRFLTTEVYANTIHDNNGNVIYQDGTFYGTSIEIGGAEATGMIKCFLDDDLEYFPAKCLDFNANDQYAAGHLLVEVDAPDAAVGYDLRFYIRPNGINGYNAANTGKSFLAWDHDNVRWTLVESGAC